MRPIALIVAALLCVVCSSANARTPHPVVSNIETSGCTDPVMRPCVGRLKIEPSVDHHHKSLKPRHYSRTNSHLITTTGLRRVMAEGAGRVVRPRAWCGWWLGRYLGMLDRKLWLARNWTHVGRPAHGPHVGAIVVWARGRRHGHVGIITGRTADGRWIVKSGNDGHRVRERPRSVADAIAFRWPA